MAHKQASVQTTDPPWLKTYGKGTQAQKQTITMAHKMVQPKFNKKKKKKGKKEVFKLSTFLSVLMLRQGSNTYFTIDRKCIPNTEERLTHLTHCTVFPWTRCLVSCQYFPFPLLHLNLRFPEHLWDWRLRLWLLLFFAHVLRFPAASPLHKLFWQPVNRNRDISHKM